MPSVNPDKAVKIFITAAGSAKRWDGLCKQLSPVCKEPLIHRTIRLTRQLMPNAEIVIVSYRQELKIDGCTYLDTKEPTESLAHTLSEMIPYMGWMNYVLMGDVFFTLPVLKQVYSSGTLQFFGNLRNFKGYHPERYACSIPEEDLSWIGESLKQCYGTRMQNELPGFATPTFWRVFADIMNLHGILGFLYWTWPHFEYLVWRSPGITIIEDPWVCDFDTPDDYLAFIDAFPCDEHGPKPKVHP